MDQSTQPVSPCAIRILTILVETGPCHVVKLAALLDEHPIHIDRMCTQLQQDDQLRRQPGGAYAVTTRGRAVLATNT